MRVGFFHADLGDPVHAHCASVMLQSVHQTMPGTHVVQFSDELTPPLDGAQEIVRGPSAPLSVMVARHYRACLGDWLFLDLDVVVQQDVRAVCADHLWDVAVAARSDGDPVLTGRELWRVMPYNCGVIFSRSQPFWTDVVAAIEAMPREVQQFMGVQQAVNDLIATRAYRVAMLPPTYNYSPHREDEDVSDKAILHFKGQGRKPWMLHRMVAA